MQDISQDDDDPISIADEMMMRGQRLRDLRRMFEEYEEERMSNALEDESKVLLKCSSLQHIDVNHVLCSYDYDSNGTSHTFGTSVSASETSSLTGGVAFEDQIDILPDSNLKALRYESYLSHQRYQDDYKHSSCTFIDYQNENQRKKQYRAIIEQSRYLGKGGLLWDAAVMLSEHLVANEEEWNICSKNYSRCKVLELGSGTGFTGITLAKATDNTHVYISDLPDLYPIMERNLKRNFEITNIDIPYSLRMEEILTMDRGYAANEIPTKKDHGEILLSEVDVKALYDIQNDDYHERVKVINQTNSKITSTILRWGMQEDYGEGPFDVIIGADIVTNLYDPEALAKTMYHLSHDSTKIYICFKKRLSGPHIVFEKAINRFFHKISFVKPTTRLYNPNDVAVLMLASAKKNIDETM